MKFKNLLMATLAVCAISFTSCSDDDEKVMNTFTIAETDGIVQITPTTNDSYVWTVLKSADIAGLTDEAIMEKVIEKYGDNIKEQMVSGANEKDCLIDLEAGENYTVVVFGYNGKIDSELAKHEFTFGGKDVITLEGLTDINQADYWGDKKEIDNGCWIIVATSTDYMKYLNLEFASPLGQSENPVGTYVITEPYGEVGTAEPGYQDGSTFEGSYYTEYYSFPAKGIFFKSGRIVIESIDSENYIVKMLVKDEENQSYYLNYKGGMYITDKTLGFGDE